MYPHPKIQASHHLTKYPTSCLKSDQPRKLKIFTWKYRQSSTREPQRSKKKYYRSAVPLGNCWSAVSNNLWSCCDHSTSPEIFSFSSLPMTRTLFPFDGFSQGGWLGGIVCAEFCTATLSCGLRSNFVYSSCKKWNHTNKWQLITHLFWEETNIEAALCYVVCFKKQRLRVAFMVSKSHIHPITCIWGSLINEVSPGATI